MAETVRARLNHYQMLGVSPDASADEIARAFAREGSVLRPHAFGFLAELCVAYETLRHPIKRRAYDASIGLIRKPTFQTVAASARQAVLAPGPVASVPAGLQIPPKAPAAASPPTPQPTPESLTKPALPLGPGADLNIRPEPRISRGGTDRLPVEELGIEARPIDWRRAGIVVGTLVVAACALGGMAGWWSASGISEAAQPENTVSLSLPRARPIASPSAPEVASEPAPARSDRPRAAIAAAARIEPMPVPAETAAVEVQSEQTAPSLGEEAAMETPAVSAVAAPMPLPNRVIARTIQRIGYSCGDVASTEPVEGEAPGVFKVTCSSGQSYAATPVNGRYRFKRWGKR